MLYDTAGVNYIGFEKLRHYSGNYWWATVQYISQLPYIPITAEKYQAEFWLFKFPVSGRHISLHTSNVDHGAVRYQRAVSASEPDFPSIESEINLRFDSWLDAASPQEKREKLSYSSYHNYDPLSNSVGVIVACIGYNIYNATCNDVCV